MFIQSGKGGSPVDPSRTSRQYASYCAAVRKGVRVSLVYARGTHDREVCLSEESKHKQSLSGYFL